MSNSISFAPTEHNKIKIVISTYSALQMYVVSIYFRGNCLIVVELFPLISRNSHETEKRSSIEFDRST